MSEDPTKNQGNSQPEDKNNTPESGLSDKDKNMRAMRENLDKAFARIKELEQEKEAEAKKKAEEEGKWKELYESELEKNKSTAKSIALEKGLKEAKIKGDFSDLALSYLRDKIEFDDNNNPTNLGNLLKELKETKPALFDQEKPEPPEPAGQVGTVNSTNGTGSPSASISEEEAKKILESGDAEKITKFKDDIAKYNFDE